MKLRVWMLIGALMLPAMAASAHGGGGVGAALQAELPGLFARADADGDGTLNASEFKTFKQSVTDKRAELMFQRLDANGDGRVTLDEITAHAAERHAGKHCQ